MLGEKRCRDALSLLSGESGRFSEFVLRGIFACYFLRAIRRSALLERGFLCISSGLGVIGFFVTTSSTPEAMSCPVIGSMVAADFSRKKCFTIRSSPEWNAIIERVPLLASLSQAEVSIFSRDRYSSLTAMRRAWNIRGRASLQAFVTISASSFVVVMGLTVRASMIFFAINPARGSSP